VTAFYVRGLPNVANAYIASGLYSIGDT